MERLKSVKKHGKDFLIGLVVGVVIGLLLSIFPLNLIILLQVLNILLVSLVYLKKTSVPIMKSIHTIDSGTDRKRPGRPKGSKNKPKESALT
jgi:F0F1-type ATP synthase assembly protein I